MYYSRVLLQVCQNQNFAPSVNSCLRKSNISASDLFSYFNLKLKNPTKNVDIRSILSPISFSVVAICLLWWSCDGLFLRPRTDYIIWLVCVYVVCTITLLNYLISRPVLRTLNIIYFEASLSRTKWSDIFLPKAVFHIYKIY